MNAENFAYWLNGYFEMLAAGENPNDALTVEQIACIKDHLALVFEKKTPNRSGDGGKKSKETREIEQCDPFAIDPFISPGVICAPEEKPVVWVAPPTNPNQVRFDIETEIKKGFERTKRLEPYRTTCKWIGGGFGRKYC